MELVISGLPGGLELREGGECSLLDSPPVWRRSRREWEGVEGAGGCGLYYIDFITQNKNDFLIKTKGKIKHQSLRYQSLRYQSLHYQSLHYQSCLYADFVASSLTLHEEQKQKQKQKQKQDSCLLGILRDER